ncbi:DNA-methyltransferase [Chryseobacterium indologenes]|uniref:DNA-methyltransferase n=1 Tax=Chryseobacterium indologenes TaxID=253 RepID=UPI0016249BAA|nr:site-specific DNA-methyltransferase [Chryseobacterium indologenes]
MKRIKLFKEDNLELMKRLPDESIDVICIDPPWLYLKNQKLERPFDEHKFFSECRRLLTKNGFIVMFGRGESFYRWNTILSDLKFTFKEEIVWDKRKITSPVLAIGRRHELVVIYAKGKAGINRVKVNFFEKNKHEPEKIKRTIERIATTFGNRESFELLKKYYDTGEKVYKPSVDSKYNVTRSKGSNVSQNRTVSFAIAIEEGVNEQSILQVIGDHYNTIHPTQKPVRLLERLLALVIPESKPREEIVVADFFGGSMSCMEAVHNMGMKGIACEIDQEYFEKGKERIEKLQPLQPELFR